MHFHRLKRFVLGTLNTHKIIRYNQQNELLVTS